MKVINHQRINGVIFVFFVASWCTCQAKSCESASEADSGSAHHTYQMIGELKVHAGHLVLRHVAARTASCRNLARFAGMRRGRRGAGCDVAAETPHVVRNRLSHEWLVRIVTGHAGESRVVRGPAAAALEPVRLRAKRRDPALVGQLHIPERRVTRSTEVD